MQPEEITRLREELGYSMSALARALEVSVNDVVAWESGDRFPTKRAVQLMERLLNEARVRTTAQPTGAPAPATDVPLEWASLADAGNWALFRKILAWPDLRLRVAKIAANFPDPADPTLRVEGASKRK